MDSSPSREAEEESFAVQQSQDKKISLKDKELPTLWLPMPSPRPHIYSSLVFWDHEG